MITLAPIAFVTLWSHAMIQGTIVKIESTRKFAGKLGYLVSEKLTIEADGRTYEVKLPAYHSRARIATHKTKVGDKYSIRA